MDITLDSNIVTKLKEDPGRFAPLLSKLGPDDRFMIPLTVLAEVVHYDGPYPWNNFCKLRELFQDPRIILSSSIGFVAKQEPYTAERTFQFADTLEESCAFRRSQHQQRYLDVSEPNFHATSWEFVDFLQKEESEFYDKKRFERAKRELSEACRKEEVREMAREIAKFFKAEKKGERYIKGEKACLRLFCKVTPPQVPSWHRKTELVKKLMLSRHHVAHRIFREKVLKERTSLMAALCVHFDHMSVCFPHIEVVLGKQKSNNWIDCRIAGASSYSKYLVTNDSRFALKVRIATRFMHIPLQVITLEDFERLPSL